MKICRETRIEVLIRTHPATLEVFRKYDMQCSDCIALETATVEEGARMHGVDLDLLLEELEAACKR